ncbi:caveolae-associated protein 2-like [Gadus macrocephalus]|uniref:caveolae-associated protein 2-like n=1 Tax=Gadus macrocephalus TaxID=80720 RepID=UPI0028CBAB44|nr:caveolae-associated protein 2-like [Gadus macrocephalus]
MVTTEEPQTQELLAPGGPPRPPSPGAGPRGPVNAITVLTLLDKLVNMLDTVQGNQHRMEVQQVDMETVVMGIQADVTKLSRNHSNTANTVSKLLDKSRKLSVTMKEVRERMERQGVQVKKLEANHAHLTQRNNFKVLIFQEEKEIPSSVFVKQPPPFPRDGVEEEEGEEEEPRPPQDGPAPEEGLHTIDLSSDEDVGLEAELEEEGEELHDLDFMEKTRAEKIKRSSLKKVDSLKRAFSKHNIEKKMTKMSSKIVSQEQRDKIKKSLASNQQRASFKVPPLSFSLRKPRSGSESQPAEPQAPSQTGDSPRAEAHVELSPLDLADEDLPFTEVHSQLAPGAAEERGEEREEERERGEEISGLSEGEVSRVSEGVSVEYSLSATLPQGRHSPSAWGEEDDEEEERGEERAEEKERGEEKRE